MSKSPKALGRNDPTGTVCNFVARPQPLQFALAEHWDVIQDEATQEQSKSGRPMFGESFPVYR